MYTISYDKYLKAICLKHDISPSCVKVLEYIVKEQNENSEIRLPLSKRGEISNNLGMKTDNFNKMLNLLTNSNILLRDASTKEAIFWLTKSEKILTREEFEKASEVAIKFKDEKGELI